MAITTIYTDGSYKKKKCGCAFLIDIHEKVPSQILGYFWKDGKSSTAAEVLAIIKSLQYMYFRNLIDQQIEIKTDDSGIVEFFSKKRHIHYDEVGWVRSTGKPVKSNVSEWYLLSHLVKMWPQGKISFTKIGRNQDSLIKMVDRYSKVARNTEGLEKDHIYILNQSCENLEFEMKEVIQNIQSKLPHLKVNNISKPWLAPMIEDKAGKKLEWLKLIRENKTVYIDPGAIHIIEDVHLKCTSLNLNGLILRLVCIQEYRNPVIVRKLDERYCLVKGLSELAAAKLANIKSIPCIIVEDDFKQFQDKYGYKADL